VWSLLKVNALSFNSVWIEVPLTFCVVSSLELSLVQFDCFSSNLSQLFVWSSWFRTQLL
jgi:hypothetical protein